jgi:integrase
MPKLRHKPPTYSLHKASGQAVVTIDGHDHYLGKYGSPESHANYRRLTAEWAATKAPRATPSRSPEEIRADLRINELLVAYLEFAEGYYVKNGRPTGEFRNMKDAVRPLQELYETMRVWDFGPAALRTVREQMIAADLSRKVVNARVNRIRRIFKWGVEHELVDPIVLQGLQSVSPLKEGRSKARETSRVKPISQEHIDAVLARVTRPVQAMIRLQLVTGMRPGEVVLMRACDIDMSGKTWEYRPASHKTEHHGKERIVFLGPQAQDIIRPFLKPAFDAYLFSPKDAVREARKRLNPKKGRSRRTLRVSGYRRCPSNVYTRSNYQTAICKACQKAKIPTWGPNRLRHNSATFLRREFGLEAARVILGHTSAAVTEIYAEMDRKRAAEIMSQVG